MPSTRFIAVSSRAVAAMVISGALAFTPAPAASASPAADPTVTLNGCTGTLDAQPNGGESGTKVTAPTVNPASKSDPIVVNWDDKMVYSGSSSAVITDHKWTASVAGFPVASGGSANAKHESAVTGSVEIRKALPLKLTGLYYVSFELSGTGGSCTGSMWLKLDGNPLTTIPFWIAVVVAMGGLLGLYWSLPRIREDGSADKHFVGGFLAGLLLGLGLLIALTVSSLAAFSQWWPYVAILSGAIFLGLLTGTVGPKRGLITAPVTAVPPAPQPADAATNYNPAGMFEAFCKLTESDPGLQAQLKAIEPGPSAAEAIAALARSKGFDVSATELRVGMGVEVLSDAELKEVSGGIQDSGTGIMDGSLKYNAIATLGAPVSSALFGVESEVQRPQPAARSFLRSLRGAVRRIFG
jgi:predicted ribosomally synthesized peptide with nif11-like leader